MVGKTNGHDSDRRNFLRLGKFFLSDCVRIAWKNQLSLSAEISRNAVKPDFSELIAWFLLVNFSGATVAIG